MHAAVITGVLPLATALAAALAFRQRPSAGFWVCAVLGCAPGDRLRRLEGQRLAGPRRPAAARPVVCAAIGYVAGARLSAQMPAERVICWVLVCQPAADAAGGAAVAGRRSRRAPRPGAASPTSRCSRCGSASSPGTAAWRSAARCASARCSWCSPSCRCCSRCRCSASGSTRRRVGFALAVVATVFVGRAMPVAPPGRTRRIAHPLSPTRPT